MCKVENETGSHTVNECKMLTQKEYKKRHDKVCRYIHWKLCEKHDFQRAQHGTSMNQMELLRTKSTRFCGILHPVFVAALGAISTGFEKYIAAIGIEMRVEHPQKTSFLGESKDFETGTSMLKKSTL